MKEKLNEIFELLNSENQTQLLDYAKMLLEIQSGEDQVADLLKINTKNSTANKDNNIDNKYIN
jgi:hypothetical protein